MEGVLEVPEHLQSNAAVATIAPHHYHGALNLPDEGEHVVIVGERTGGRCAHRQKDASLELRVGTLNVGTMTGKAGGRDAESGSPT